MRGEESEEKPVQENLITGMYIIMRKLGGYRHQHFFADNFMASEYFGLLDLVNEEIREESKQLKKTEKKNGRKSNRHSN